ncbi:MAG: hypothetical protein FWG07_02190 [Treponema sp.]|nr:hypothetical protein [Treponema sp.]
MIKTTVLLLFAQLVIVQLIRAQETLDIVKNPEKGISSGRELSLQLSTRPGAKFIFTQNFIFPFLEGSGSLTEDNNIALALTAEISPVSVNGLAETIWTPIAFFQLAAGGRIGSGWNLNLSGREVRGIGINREKHNSNRVEHVGSAFDGLLWKIQTGAVLQFDLAAFFPGDWNHVVTRTYHEINYAGYTAARAGESWYFEDDDGENINGFNYYGNLFIGYQMPVILDTVGILAEADIYLYDTPGRSSWGDERIRWKFALVGNIAFNENVSMTMLVQFCTERNYTNPDWKDLYYRNRNIDKSNPLSLVFYQAALAVTYKF